MAVAYVSATRSPGSVHHSAGRNLGGLNGLRYFHNTKLMRYCQSPRAWLCVDTFGCS